MSAIALSCFAIALALFQMSCQKNATAENPSTTTSGIIQLNKIVVCKQYFNGTTEIWTANYDGSDYKKINITLPTGFGIKTSTETRLSPDGQTVFFNVVEQYSGSAVFNIHVYSCNIDGSNPKKVISGAYTNNTPNLGGAY